MPLCSPNPPSISDFEDEENVCHVLNRGMPKEWEPCWNKQPDDSTGNSLGDSLDHIEDRSEDKPHRSTLFVAFLKPAKC